MANEYSFVVVLPNIDGMAAHSVQNSFNFKFGAGPSVGDISAVAAKLADFYNVAGTTNPLAAYLSNGLSRAASAVQVRTYPVAGHLNGSPHGSPSQTDVFTLGAGGGAADLPDQVAVVMTYYAADVLSVPEVGGADANIPTPKRAQNYGAPAVHAGFDKLRARKRGRIYLGPLNNGTVQSSSATGNPTVLDGFATDIATAFGRLVDDTAELTNPAVLSVWSRRNAAFDAVSSTTADTIGWVDKSFDVQRRRKFPTVARQAIVVPA